VQKEILVTTSVRNLEFNEIEKFLEENAPSSGNTLKKLQRHEHTLRQK
jgi:hypothetical protein